MCFALPYKIESIKNNIAIVGDNIQIDTVLAGKVKKGDWVLVKDKYAVNKISEKEALDMIELLDKTRKAGGQNVC
ncbi:HypC/HybG/HupF family hydrogenase formation chaperone [bacterium]|nr:HypC/HybG/HupF family hydrogenase formation chaperone [bacterium]